MGCLFSRIFGGDGIITEIMDWYFDGGNPEPYDIGQYMAEIDAQLLQEKTIKQEKYIFGQKKSDPIDILVNESKRISSERHKHFNSAPRYRKSYNGLYDT